MSKEFDLANKDSRWYKAEGEILSEEKSIEEQAKMHCNLLAHKIDVVDVYSAFILGAKAQRKICDTEEAHRWAALLKHLVREGLLTPEDVEDIRRTL